jgi:hypothetical protein
MIDSGMTSDRIPDGFYIGDSSVEFEWGGKNLDGSEAALAIFG